jgi:hypothetical protein
MNFTARLFYPSFILLVSVFTVISCSNTPTNKPAIQVTVEEPKRMRFSGKGSGAGMMLMGAMGPMGIAIGVAIDEGIAKDIEQQALAAGFDIEALVKEAALITSNNTNTNKEQHIHMKQYGFVLIPGDNDPSSPQFHFIVSDGSKIQQEVKYPEDFSAENLPTAPLEIIKADGKVSIDLFKQALKMALQ